MAGTVRVTDLSVAVVMVGEIGQGRKTQVKLHLGTETFLPDGRFMEIREHRSLRQTTLSDEMVSQASE